MLDLRRKQAYDCFCHVYLRCTSGLQNEDSSCPSGRGYHPGRLSVEGTRSARERCKARGSAGRETEVRSVSIRDLEQASLKLIVSKPAPAAGVLWSRHGTTESYGEVPMARHGRVLREEGRGVLQQLGKGAG